MKHVVSVSGLTEKGTPDISGNVLDISIQNGMTYHIPRPLSISVCMNPKCSICCHAKMSSCNVYQ